MSTTHELAGFIEQLSFADIPASVIEHAKQLALHSWGVQLASSTLPWSRSTYRYGRTHGGSQATIVNYGHRTSAEIAAFVNSAFAHGFETDDNHARTSIKGGCVVIPTALAMAERELSNGKEFLTAVVLGYELMIRSAFALHPAENERGTHPTGTSGALGAAAMASKLMRLPAGTTAHALGAAAASRSGFNEIPSSGRGHFKRIFGSMAASSGIRAADLASFGLTTPDTTLDVGAGLCRAFDVEEERHAHFTRGLGSEWETLTVHFKVYAQDGYIQPMSQALEQIRKEHSFDVDDIEHVWVGTNRRARNEVVGVIREPKTLTDAQFSANFSVALFLVRGGASFHEYTEEALRDPAIIDLSQRVSIEVDDEIDEEYRRTRPRGAKVVVRLKDGRELRHTVPHLRPMTGDELDAKFRRLSQVVLTSQQSDAILEAGHALDTQPDLTEISTLLARGRTR